MYIYIYALYTGVTAKQHLRPNFPWFLSPEHTWSWCTSGMLARCSRAIPRRARSGTGNGGYEMVANHPILKNLNRNTVNHSMQF